MSQGTPLLSNLDIIENIALIKEVHERLSQKAAQKQALEALEAVGYAYIGRFRSVNCNVKELFIAQLIRASMMQYAKITIIRPFVMLKDTEEIPMILDALRRIKEGCDCEILDMKLNRSKYEAGGEACSIIE